MLQDALQIVHLYLAANALKKIKRTENSRERRSLAVAWMKEEKIQVSNGILL